MTKILTDVDGVLINTDYYEFQMEKAAIQDVWQITATYVIEPGLSLIVYQGSGQECRQYLRKLAALTGAFEYKDGGFHRVGGDNE